MENNFSIFVRTAYSYDEDKNTTTVVEFDKAKKLVDSKDIFSKWYLITDIYIHSLREKMKKKMKDKTIYVLFTQSHKVGQKQRILTRATLNELLKKDRHFHRVVKEFNTRKLIEHEGEYTFEVLIAEDGLLTYDLLNTDTVKLFSKTLIIE